MLLSILRDKTHRELLRSAPYFDEQAILARWNKDRADELMLMARKLNSHVGVREQLYILYTKYLALTVERNTHEFRIAERVVGILERSIEDHITPDSKMFESLRVKAAQEQGQAEVDLSFVCSLWGLLAGLVLGVVVCNILIRYVTWRLS
ncbi:unnamed protein product [Mycena citricolor]|uniref:Uncharacterized protein n=1 Tax=Mycena citricolor TaxID=2018698 RepID=A0AAD2HYQ7_9AGAR|nr:unnamed protein product [Mycena citricolor]